MQNVHAAITEAPAVKEPVVPGALSPIHVRNIAFTLLAFAIVILLLQLMRPVLIPFAVGGLLFYALDPAVDWLQSRRVPRSLGAALMLFVAVAGCGGLAYSLQGQAFTVIDQLPQGAHKLAALLRKERSAEPSAVEKVQQAADVLQKVDTPVTAPSGVVRVQVQKPMFEAGSFVWSSSMGLIGAVNQAVMVLFLTYFMLLSDQLFKQKLIDIVGSRSQRKLTVDVLNDIAGQIQKFLVIQILTSAGVAIVTAATLWMMGLRQAALWGLLAGVFNSIPYYGALLVTTGLAIVGFMQFGTLGMTAAVAGVALLITTIEGSFLTPLLMGRACSMNQVTVFAGLLFWSWVWGIWGMLLAVPMMVMLKVICGHVEAMRPVAHFMSE